MIDFGKYIILTIVLFFLTACREDICYDHFKNTKVAITYEQEWERDYGSNHSENWNAETPGGEYDSLRTGFP